MATIIGVYIKGGNEKASLNRAFYLNKKLHVLQVELAAAAAAVSPTSIAIVIAAARMPAA
jgi:hypothetical protein